MRTLPVCVVFLFVTGCSNGAEVREFKGHQSGVNSVAFSPDGCFIASASNHWKNNNAVGDIRLWDVKTGKLIRQFEGHTLEVMSVAFSPDGRSLLSGSRDGTVRIWDVQTGNQLRLFKGHEGQVFTVAFSPDGRFALSGGGKQQEHGGKTVFTDCIIRLWGVNTGKELRTFEGHKKPIGKVAFAPDGKQFLSSSSVVRLWETDTGNELRCWDPLADRTIEFPGGSVAFSSDGKRALVGGLLYDTQTSPWQLLRKTRGDVFSPEGKRSLSVEKGLIQLWDLETGKELWQTYGHKNKAGVTSVAFSPDGKYALSGGKGWRGSGVQPAEDHVIRMWKLPE